MWSELRPLFHVVGMRTTEVQDDMGGLDLVDCPLRGVVKSLVLVVRKPSRQTWRGIEK